MMTRKIVRGLRDVMVVAIVVATPLVVGPGAFADPGDASHVDEVTAAVDADGIAVTGQATFVDVPGVVGEDATDDAVPPAAPLGHELTTATIARPDPLANPFVSTLRFTLEIANQPPQANGVPEFVEYLWHFSTEQVDVTLLAWRSNQLLTESQGTADPVFLMCPSNGGACHMLTGSMGDRLVAWNVPLLQIGQVGSVITSVDGIEVVFGSSRTALSGSHTVREVFGEPVVVLDDMATDTAYTVPGPVVGIGIAPAGTAPEDVPLTVAGAVNSQGAFNGRLPTPDTPGEYTIVVQACHGSDSCSTATTTITV